RRPYVLRRSAALPREVHLPMRSSRICSIVAAVTALALVLPACGDKSPTGKNGALAPAIGSVFPGRGPTEGQTVALIRGLNFEDKAAVTFGDSAALEVTWVDARTL